MYNRRITTHLAIFTVCCFLLVFQTNKGNAADQQAGAETTFTLSEVKSDIGEDQLTVVMIGDSTPAYTSRELYDPYRLIIDIADVALGEDLQLESLLPDNKFATLQTTVVRGLKPEITRFVFTISDGYRQKVQRQGSELVVTILPAVETMAGTPEKPGTLPTVAASSAEGAAGAGLNDSTDAGAKIREMIESSTQEVASDKPAATEELASNFDFSGYKRERISIDFYKMDLHNVFRLFRQVSGLNLIVDEGVSGSLTLALSDVPWDFALDVILNLSDLEKEERFNTIIVYPKGKEFDWPKRASDNLSFEANLEVVEQEALIIEQSANQPKEIVEAKELMRQARNKERSGDYEEAAGLYEQAAELWPDNSNLTTKLSAMYLVRLGMNAKGVFYARKSLEVKPDNHKAALYAAIGMANMNKIPEAVEYFSQSISGTPPMKEALASFAAFSESNGRETAALKLYDKYNETYGQTVNTMVAKARIFDKLGMKDKAEEQYRSVLASGFQLQVGLRQYIENRLAEAAQ
jgi:type IV pilus assembly protein PilQ